MPVTINAPPQKISEKGIYFYVPFNKIGGVQNALQMSNVTISFDDGRTISRDQQKKIFAMVSDIADYCTTVKNKREYKAMLHDLQLMYLIDTSNTESVRRQLTLHFCELQNIELFSLSNCSMSLAKEFIDWLVELAVKHDIPCNDTLLNRCEDISKYIYCCLMFKKCCISGKKSELHHVDAVGMGRDRKEIVHLGYRVLPLSRAYHTEAHTIGQKSFDEKYKVYGIKLDKRLCEIWKVRSD